MQTIPPDHDLRAIESLLAFWRDAGLDVCLEDAPVDRTIPVARPEPRQVATLTPVPTAVGVGIGIGQTAPPDLAEAIAEAREAAAAAQDLKALEAAIAAFRGCPLRNEGAKRAVFARGRPDPDVLIVGEAPGADEDASGEPFVGRAGKLLDRMLLAAGLQDRVLITNTVFWRPPGNRSPAHTEQAVCAPFVERAIILARPKALLLLGATSAKFMLKRDEGILSLRGQWADWHAAEGGLAVPAMPSLHPAFLLRQPGAKKKAWSDLLSLTQRVDKV